MNRSIYVIKPEAMSARETIRERIVQAGLRIIRTAEVVVPADMLDLIYTDLSPDLRKATQMFMGHKPCEIGEVEGEDAVNRLVAVCGNSTDPAQCEPYTIRRCFGVRRAERVGNAAYFRNGIHRPKSQAEAQRDLRIFSALLEQAASMRKHAVFTSDFKDVKN